MKKVLAITAVMLLTQSLSLQAQNVNPNLSFAKKLQQHIYGKQQSKSKVLAAQIRNSKQIATAQKPTEIKQRVIGQYFYSNTEEFKDSTRYYYSEVSRGSEYDYGKLIFNTQHEIASAPIYTFQELGADFPKSKMGAQADRIENYLEAIYEPVKKSTAHYNAQNKIDTLTHEFDGGGEEEKNIKYYNSQGHIEKIVSFYNDGDTAQLHKIGYNANFTELVYDSAYSYYNNLIDLEDITVSIYGYNNDNVETIYLMNIDLVNDWADTLGRARFSYNANNQLIETMLEENMGSNTYILNQKDSLVYLPNVDYPVSEYYMEYINNTLEFGNAFIKTIGPDGKPTTITVQELEINQSTPMWLNAALGTYTYNSYQNPTSILLTNAENIEETATIEFKYEEYDDVSVKEVNTLTGVSVYPNPTEDQLFISIKNLDNSTVTELKIIDLNGKVILKQEHKASTQEISLRPLPTGIYLLQINNGAKLYQQKILKQ
jgi:hypothetical protein